MNKKIADFMWVISVNFAHFEEYVANPMPHIRANENEGSDEDASDEEGQDKQTSTARVRPQSFEVDQAHWSSV